MNSPSLHGCIHSVIINIGNAFKFPVNKMSKNYDLNNREY